MSLEFNYMAFELICGLKNTNKKVQKGKNKAKKKLEKNDNTFWQYLGRFKAIYLLTDKEPIHPKNDMIIVMAPTAINV